MSLAACLMLGFLSLVGNVAQPDETGHAVMEATLPRFMNVMASLGAEKTLINFKQNQTGA